MTKVTCSFVVIYKSREKFGSKIDCWSTPRGPRDLERRITPDHSSIFFEDEDVAYCSALFRGTPHRFATRCSPVNAMYFQADFRNAAGNSNANYCSLQCASAPQHEVSGGAES
jgi:hypothetical protein